MKYIIKKDMTGFFKKNLKIIIGIILVIIIYGIYAKLNYEPSRLFQTMLGLQLYEDDFDIDRIVFFVHIMFSFYIMVWLFYDMVKGNIEMIFLRLSMHKWLWYKIISMIVITILIKALLYGITLIITGYIQPSVFLYYIIDCMNTGILQIIGIALLCSCYRNKIFLLIPLCLIGLGITIGPITVGDIILQPVFVVVLISIGIIVSFLLKFVQNKKYVSVFEGSK